MIMILPNLSCIVALKDALITTDRQCSLFYSLITDLDKVVENLRDANLELEVKNFINCQDVAMLEARLLKYQHHFKADEECNAFKAELVNLLEENKNQINANACLQRQLMSLTEELQAMQDMAAEARELQMILQKANEQMEQEAIKVETELDTDTVANIKGEKGTTCPCGSKIMPAGKPPGFQQGPTSGAQSNQRSTRSCPAKSYGSPAMRTALSPTKIPGPCAPCWPCAKSSNIAKTSIDVSEQRPPPPVVTPENQEEEFVVAPEEIQEQTDESAPEVTQEQTYDVIPEESQEQAFYDVIPENNLEQTDDTALEVSQEQTYDAIPEETLEQTDDTAPEVSQEQTYDAIPEEIQAEISEPISEENQEEVSDEATKENQEEQYDVVPAEEAVDISQEEIDNAENVYEVSPANAAESEEADNILKKCECGQLVVSKPPCSKKQNKSVVKDEKAAEFNQFEDLLHKTQEKLDKSLRNNETMKCELLQLITEIQNYDGEHARREDSSSLCQAEIECCKENLCDLKQKFYKLKQILNRRNQQYCQLEAKYMVQTNMSDCLKKQLHSSKMHYESEICELKCTVCDLNNRLLKTTNEYELMQEELKQSQNLLIDATMREKKLEKDISELEHMLRQAHQEEQKLCCCVEELKGENNSLKNGMAKVEDQYCLACSQIDELKTAAKQQMDGAYEKIGSIKGELVNVCQDRSNLKLQNQELQACVCELRDNTMQYEKDAEEIKEEMRLCMCDLEAVKAERDYLEGQCRKQKGELKMLHTAYANLNQDFQQVTELVANLEIELSNSKTSAIRMREESECVLNNAKAWLEEEAIIKDQLLEKNRSDEFELLKLRQKVSTLEQYECQCLCTCSTPRQRGGGNPIKKYKQCNSVKQCRKILKSLGSYNAEALVENENYLPGNMSGYATEMDSEEYMEDYASKVWLTKVESMTHELQKCNKYWKNKLLDKEYMVSRDDV